MLHPETRDLGQLFLCVLVMPSLVELLEASPNCRDTDLHVLGNRGERPEDALSQDKPNNEPTKRMHDAEVQAVEDVAKDGEPDQEGKGLQALH